MSIKDCIDTSVDAGLFTLEEGQRLKARFDALFRQLNSRGAAREALVRELDAEAKEARRIALMTEVRRKLLTEAVLNHRNVRGEQDPAEALTWLIEHNGEARFADIHTMSQQILARHQTRLTELLREFEKGLISGDLARGFGEKKVRLDNVVRELFGENTGDPRAAAMAKAWAEVANDLRLEFNGAGGNIAFLERWGLPQHHDAEALQRVGPDKWADDIINRLDRERMLSPLTGERLTDDELQAALRDVWQAITTDGWSRREPSGAAVGRGALFKRRQDHRFLIFKSADDWLAYQRDYGDADPFSTMMGHISTMSRDIAMMRVMGPNPEAMRTYLKQLAISMASRARSADAIVGDQRRVMMEILGDPGLTALHTAMRDRLVDAEDFSRMIGDDVRRGRRVKQSDVDAASAMLSQSLERLRLFDAGDFGQLLDAGAVATMRNATPAERAQAEMALRRLRDLDEELAAAIAARRLLVPGPGQTPIDRVRQHIARHDAMWDVMTGAWNVPTHGGVANVLSTARNLVTASTLGSAMLSAIGDVGFQAAARKFAGIEGGSVPRIVGDVLGHMTPGTKSEAVEAGLILDSAVHTMHRQARYAGSISSKGLSEFLVDRVLSLQGLSAWTQAGKHAFGMAFYATLARHVDRDFGQLHPALRRTFVRHGLSADDWDVMRRADLYEPQAGIRFLRPRDVMNQDVAEKFHAMVLRETRFAVPEGGIRSRSHLVMGQPGSLMGEISRNFAQFKSFGVVVVMLYGRRIASEFHSERGLRGSVAYAVPLLITLTLLGGLAMQLKELANGREPRDMRSAEFWGGAILQAGGLGIYGDFLFANVNRFGGGLTSTVAGPLVGKVDRLRDSTIGNVFKAVDDESRSNLGRDAVNVLRDWTPGGSLWYARLAYERILLDQLQTMLDPDAQRSFRRKMQQRRSQFGNAFWWRPGELAPRL